LTSRTNKELQTAKKQEKEKTIVSAMDAEVLGMGGHERSREWYSVSQAFEEHDFVRQRGTDLCRNGRSRKSEEKGKT